MSEIKQAYQQGIVAQVQRRPILTTLLVGGVGYLLYDKFKKAIEEAKAESRTSSADTTGSASSNVSPFNYAAFNNYWKSGNRLPKGYKVFTDASARQLANNIYNAIGYFGDDDDKIKAQFKACNSKVKVAQVSEAFTKMHSRDLITYIRDGVGVSPAAGMSDDTFQEVLKYVNSLPTYTK